MGLLDLMRRVAPVIDENSGDEGNLTFLRRAARSQIVHPPPPALATAQDRPRLAGFNPPPAQPTAPPPAPVLEPDASKLERGMSMGNNRILETTSDVAPESGLIMRPQTWGPSYA